MAQRTVDINIIDIVKEYIEVISKHYNIKAVYLFGSFAKGNNNENSDIDIAIISDEFNDKFDDMVELMMLTRDIDLRIEPHPIKTEEFDEVDTPFIDEIIRTGIELYAA